MTFNGKVEIKSYKNFLVYQLHSLRVFEYLSNIFTFGFTDEKYKAAILFNIESTFKPNYSLEILLFTELSEFLPQTIIAGIVIYYS